MTETKYYIATSLSRKDDHNYVRDCLNQENFRLTYDWTLEILNSHYVDDLEALAKRASEELAGVLNSDVVLVLLPGGIGTQAELGAALASGKKVFLHARNGLVDEHNQTSIFYRHENVNVYPGGSLKDFVDFVLDNATSQ